MALSGKAKMASSKCAAPHKRKRTAQYGKAMTHDDIEASVVKFNPTIGQRMYRTNQAMQEGRRLLNNRRRNRTLARASMPKSKRNHAKNGVLTDGNYELVPVDMNPDGSMNTERRSLLEYQEQTKIAKRKKMKHFIRKKPAEDYFERVKELESRAKELDRIAKEGKVSLKLFLKGKDKDKDAKEIAKATEIQKQKEMRWEICQCELDSLKTNFSLYESQVSSSKIELDALIAVEKKKKAELDARIKEVTAMMREDLSDFAEKNKSEMETNVRQLKDEMAKIGPPAKGGISQYFVRASDSRISEMDRYYKDFYYDIIVGALGEIKTKPYLEVVKQKELQYDRKRQRIDRNRNIAKGMGGDPVCENCGSEDVILDYQTKFNSCKKCGRTTESAHKYSQSYAESQASTIRHTAPYERLAHVSLSIMQLFIYINTCCHGYSFLSSTRWHPPMKPVPSFPPPLPFQVFLVRA